MSAPTFTELEAAASAIIRNLKTVSEFSDAKIAIIGGLGLWKYLRGYHTTNVSLTYRKPHQWLMLELVLGHQLSHYYPRGSKSS
jgi:hypothetical protein